MAPLEDRPLRAQKAKKAADWVGLWIALSTWCTLSGWVLSSLHAVNALGYGISFAFFAGGLWRCRESLGLSPRAIANVRLRSFRSRLWLPKIWLLLTLLILVGGLLHHPNNYDFLSYRFTRVLHWAWDQKWHWITTKNDRMNQTGTGFEWIMMPLFVLFKTDRLFFLIDFTSFLLLPGLVFSVFRRMGISKRLSWWWMWLLPCSYCYALQGASVSNDLFGAVYILAAFHYTLKIGEKSSPSTSSFFYSCLALALATGAKISNVPLGLPWVIVAFLRRDHLVKIRPIFLVGIFLLAACVSFLPSALLNITYTGTYTGDPGNVSRMQLDSPVAGLIGNSLLMGVYNLRPPVWPSQIPLTDWIPDPLKHYLAHAFPRFAIEIDQLQIEESGGLGVGVAACVLMMIALRLWAAVYRPDLILRLARISIPIFVGTLVALLVLMSKLGNEGVPRLITPYYPLLIAGVVSLLALDGTVVHYIVFKTFAYSAFALTLFLIIITPARPLYPTSWAVNAMSKISPARVERLSEVYSVYGSRNDAMRDLRLRLPAEEKAVGLLQDGDAVESTLWLPYGSRQIIDVMPEQTLAQLKALHLHLVIVEKNALSYDSDVPLQNLLKKWSATVVSKQDLLIKVTQGPTTWYVIALP